MEFHGFSLKEHLVCYLVQPKNVLISAIGDLLYGYIMLFIYGFTIHRFLLFTLFTITGGLIITGVAIILGSLSFWFGKIDAVADVVNSLIINFATYPDGIFKGLKRYI